jgi:hypothetical protein
MSIPAAILAAQPNSSLNAPSERIVSLGRRNGGLDEPSSIRALAAADRADVETNGSGRVREDDFGPMSCFRFVSRPLLGHCFGAFPAPVGTRSSALPIAPVPGLGSSQNKFVSRGTERRTNFFRAQPRKQTFGTWEPGPLAQLRPV